MACWSVMYIGFVNGNSPTLSANCIAYKYLSFLNSPFFFLNVDTKICRASACWSYSNDSCSVKSDTKTRETKGSLFIRD